MKRTLHPVFLKLLPLAAALLLAGCASALPELPQPLPVPAHFKAAQGERWTVAPPSEAQPRGEWWKAFSDAVLDSLVERAVVNNTGLQAAAARLAEARALVRNAEADRRPQLGVGAGATRQAGTAAAVGANPATVLQAGASFSYEVDLSGRLARARDAASLDAASREALLQSTRLMVQAETAQTYLALRATDAESGLLQATVAAHADTLRLTQRRLAAGDIAELDVARAQTELAATEAEAFAVQRRRAQLEHALAVLAGETASSFALDPAPWVTALPSIPSGIPGTVLARRPDVAAAQEAMLAAQARLGIARSAWFPSVSLTGNGGFASLELRDLFQWSARAWGVGALLSLPVFDGGRREAGVQGAQARLEEAAALHRGQVLGAFRDVEDQLSALRLLHDQSQAQERAVASAQRATRLSDTRWRNGLVSQLELLDARRTELFNRRQALQVRSAQYQGTVGLIRALGGGWDVVAAQDRPAPVVVAATPPAVIPAKAGIQ